MSAPTQHRAGTVDQEPTDVPVTTLADTTDRFPATARMLAWRKAKPGCELPSGAKMRRVTHRGDDRHREQLRLALIAFRQTSNQTWIIEWHGYKTPVHVRANQISQLPRVA